MDAPRGSKRPRGEKDQDQDRAEVERRLAEVEKRLSEVEKRLVVRPKSPAEEERVCFVCRMMDDGFDYYFFVRNLCRGYIVQDLVPLVQLEFMGALSICGIDSTAFMVESFSRNYESREPLPIYYLDLDPNKHKSLRLNLSSGDLSMLPPMSDGKDNAVITRVPNSKRFLVFSTAILFSRRNNHLGDDIYEDVVAATVDPDAEAPVDFEMYDVGRGSWVTLPRICIRIAQRGRWKSPSVFQLYDPVACTWNKLRELTLDEDRLHEILITRFTFIDDTTLVVAVDLGFLLKLDLASMRQGWKVYEKGGNGCAGSKVFVISETLGDTWCASDIKVPKTMYSRGKEHVKLPRSLFDVNTEESHIFFNPLERKKGKEYVCALQTALRKSNGYPQMVIDVVDAGGDEEVKRVASYRAEFRQECLSAFPICIFQYHQPQSSSHQLNWRINSSTSP